MNIDYINTGYSKVHKAHQIIPLIFKGKLLLGSVIISGICLLKRKKERFHFRQILLLGELLPVCRRLW